MDQGVVGGGKSEIEPLEMAVCIVSSKQTESEQHRYWSFTENNSYEGTHFRLTTCVCCRG